VPDRRLRDAIAQLAAIDRSSAPPRGREAAQWIAARLSEWGCSARVEQERAHGGLWFPLLAPAALASAAGLLAARAGGRRAWLGAALLGALCAAAVWDEVGGGRLWFRRRFLPGRPTWNVVAETGDVDSDRTLLLVSHHDGAARRRRGSGPAPPRAMPPLAKRVDGDDLTGVATLIGVAIELAERPLHGLRVLLVSTGAEQGFMEGMHAFAERHFAELERDRTHVVCVDTAAAPRLALIEAEGILRMRGYPEELKQLVCDCARDAGVELRRGVRLRNATDGLIALRAGYPTVAIGSVAPSGGASSAASADVAARVEQSSVEDAIALCAALARRIAASPDPRAASQRAWSA
jgi:hypothetical protein